MFRVDIPKGKKLQVKLFCLFIFLSGFLCLGLYWQYRPSTVTTTKLTNEEWLWLTANPDKLVIANSGEYPPFFYLNRKGQWTGLAFDYLSIIEKRLGCQFKHIYFEDNAQLLAALENKEIAFIINAEPTVPGYAGLLYSEYVSTPFAVYIQDSRQMKSFHMDNLKGKEIAVRRNSAGSFYLELHFPDLRLNFTDNDLAALLRLASGNSDAAFVNQGTAAYYFDELRLPGLRQAALVGENLSMNYGVRSDLPEMYRILIKSIVGIDEKYRENTTARWLKQQPANILASPTIRKIILGIILGGALLVMAFFVWNTALRKQVAKQTGELQQALEDRYEMERQLLQTSKVEALGSLASGIAHDFNNMLTAIIGYAESKEVMKISDQVELATALQKQQEKVEKIRAVAGRARNLVQKILSFARNREIKPTRVLATNAIQDCLNFADGLFPRTLSIKKEFSAHEDTIWADPTYITQIMLNLLSNASDAMHGQGQIVIKTQNISINKDYCSDRKSGFCLPCCIGEYFILIVQDSGPGISKEVQSRMFEAFYTTKSLNKGTGMGLHIVRDIVRRLGGSIRVVSSSRGTSFQVFLPIWQGQEETAVTCSEFFPKQCNDLVDVQAVTSLNTKPAVLYVEDDDNIRERGSLILAQLGCIVHTSSSSEEAIELITSGDIRELNLLLTDYVLPGLSGLDLALKIRQSFPNIKIVLCSGREDLANHLDWKLAGVSEFYAKPLRTRDYAKLLRYCLPRSK